MLKRAIVILTFLTCWVMAQERPGSTAANFLKIDVSPRGAAMGGAFISVAEGAEAAFYNPAALAEMQGWDVVFNHNEWFADINHEYLSIAHNFGTLVGSFALSVNALYTDEMLVRTPLQPDGTGETFFAGSYLIGLSYARKMTHRVSLGGSINYLHIGLFDEFTANAFTFDLSLTYNTGFRGHRFALGIYNFGRNIKFVNEDYPMPTNFIFGMSINGFEKQDYKVMFSITGQKPNDLDPLAQSGVEIDILNVLDLRGGYVFGHDVARYSFGAGLKTKQGGNFQIRANYSFNDFTALGGSHRIGLGFSF